MIEWFYFPQSLEPTALVRGVVAAFENVESKIASPKNTLDSNGVLLKVRPELEVLGFKVETGKKRAEKITVPVLFGRNGKTSKAFDADAYHVQGKFVLEIEAGRAVSNNQFLKDLFQACLMVDVDYLGIAVRRVYEAGNATGKDFETVVTFFETLQASRRLPLPLKGVLILGY
ncbi:MAG: hypothetical protein FJW32_30170 [Acidobacteria bacterium]|nr:hypothetical protein [Acidobacteriota bacterium]